MSEQYVSLLSGRELKCIYDLKKRNKISSKYFCFVYNHKLYLGSSYFVVRIDIRYNDSNNFSIFKDVSDFIVNVDAFERVKVSDVLMLFPNGMIKIDDMNIDVDPVSFEEQYVKAYIGLFDKVDNVSDENIIYFNSVSDTIDDIDNMCRLVKGFGISANIPIKFKFMNFENTTSNKPINNNACILNANMKSKIVKRKVNSSSTFTVDIDYISVATFEGRDFND